MIDAGITDSESQEGIDFCVNHCPYEEGCIVMEGILTQTSTRLRKDTNKRKVWVLWQAGFSVKEIAHKMGMHERTVHRYIRVGRNLQ